jgi:hypothetical protein
MLTVLITYHTGLTDIRDCLDLSDICLDGVLSLRIIRDERTIKHARAA